MCREQPHPTNPETEAGQKLHTLFPACVTRERSKKGLFLGGLLPPGSMDIKQEYPFGDSEENDD